MLNKKYRYFHNF